MLKRRLCRSLLSVALLASLASPLTVAQIHVANTDGTDNFQLTFAEKTSNNPQWSPDSKRLAFTSTRNGKNNLYLLRMAGGEAEQLTDTKSAGGAVAGA